MLNEWASIAEIVASIAVVGTLVYVARQLHQNTELLKSVSRQALVTNDHAAAQVWIEHSDLFDAVISSDALSKRDQFRFSMLWIMDMRNREHEYFQYKAGVLDEPAWKSYREAIRVSGSNERVRTWWNAIGKHVFDQGFVQMVDELHAGSLTDNLFARLGDWE